MKIRPVGAKLFHTNRRTDGLIDMTTTIVAFRSFANAPKNGTLSKHSKSTNTIIIIIIIIIIIMSSLSSSFYAVCLVDLF